DREDREAAQRRVQLLERLRHVERDDEERDREREDAVAQPLDPRRRLAAVPKALHLGWALRAVISASDGGALALTASVSWRRRAWLRGLTGTSSLGIASSSGSFASSASGPPAAISPSWRTSLNSTLSCSISAGVGGCLSRTTSVFFTNRVEWKLR